MTPKVPPARTCRWCGATWRNSGKGDKRERYCSTACREAARHTSNGGAVPVGRRFVRIHDGAECEICQDERGLPFAEEVRKLELKGQGQ